LLHLEIEAIIQKEDSVYRLIDPHRSPDYKRWQAVSQQRRTELAQMQAYIHHSGCLMNFIAQALDDPNPVQACGRCKHCRRQESKFQADPQVVEAASRFLRQGQPILIESRKQWPSGFSDQWRGRFKPPNMPGLALCYYHDQGWAELVRSGKYRNHHYPDELVEASAELLVEHWQTLPDSPTWVTAVPSLRRPELVPDFARRLAKALDLPYRNAVRKVRDCPEQKTMLNSYQQVANLLDAFVMDDSVLAQPVLLVDDMHDSGWTLTMIGELLRQAGSGDVYPFVLARLSATGI
jgi:ATP-dependent DNA helicase RecQ